MSRCWELPAGWKRLLFTRSFQAVGGPCSGHCVAKDSRVTFRIIFWSESILLYYLRGMIGNGGKPQ